MTGSAEGWLWLARVWAVWEGNLLKVLLGSFSCIEFFMHWVAGLIQPTLLEDGQVRVDMGLPVLEGLRVPTTLEPTHLDGSVVEQVREGCATLF